MALKIAIRLDPSRMENPDLDIRYKIPDLLSESTGGSIRDDGYDYVDGDKLAIFLLADSSDPTSTVLEALGADEICGNRILDSAVIGVDRGNGYEIVHPKDFAGEFVLE